LKKKIFNQPVNPEDIDLDELVAGLLQYRGLFYNFARFRVAKSESAQRLGAGLNLFDGIIPDKDKTVFIDWQLISHKDYNEVIHWFKKKDLPYYYIQVAGVNETIKEVKIMEDK